jgi:hypothetical protein
MNRAALPHIGISYEDRVPEAVFDEFRNMVAAEGLDLEIEARESAGPFAGIEWLIPTAVILFVTQSYFAGFLGEMGKDHYALFKQGVKGLRKRFNQVKVTVIGTPGKASAEQPYSLLYSICFEGVDGRMFKFLVPSAEYDPANGEKAMDAFLDFLEAYYGGALEKAHSATLSNARDFGRTVLVAYDPVAGRIWPIDAVSRTFEGMSVQGSEGGKPEA